MNRFTIFSISALLGLQLVIGFVKDAGTPAATTGAPQAPAFVGQRWQMTSFQLNPSVDFDGDGTVDSDLLAFMPECDRDNALSFSPDGKISTSEGQKKCARKFADSKSKNPDSWSYDSETRTITLTDGNNPKDVSTWEVIDVSAQALTIKTTVMEGGKQFDTILRWKAI